jgi:hypothetical protein
VRCGHYWWNRRDVVGASRPISARILGTQTGCWDALATVGASGLVYVWLTVACRGDFFHSKPVKLTLSPPPFIINSLIIKPLKVTFILLIIIWLFLNY